MLRGINGIVVNRGEIFLGATCLAGVYVYPAGASGSVAPLRAIAGIDTAISGAEGVARFGQEIYVAVNLDSVRVYPASAGGDAPPTRTITGPHTGFGFVYGVAVF